MCRICWLRSARWRAAAAGFWLIPLVGRVALFRGELWAPEVPFQLTWLLLSLSGVAVVRPAWHRVLAVLWAVLLVGFLVVARGPLALSAA